MNLKIEEIIFNSAYVVTPKVYYDHRGSFFESWNKKVLNDLLNLNCNFVQDNHSISVHGTLRGLHYQVTKPQGKLVRVVCGEIFDVIVDIRKSSNTFGKWHGVYLSSNNMKQIWIPPGFAHGFLVLSSKAEVIYKTTNYWFGENERTIIWNDKDISIKWPKTNKIIISDKDKCGLFFNQSEYFK